MCCKQIQNYGCKRSYMEHTSLTHQILGLMSLFYVQLNLLVNTSTRFGTIWFRRTFLIHFHLVLRNHNVVISLYKDMDSPKLVQWKYYSKSLDVKTSTLPVLDLEFLKHKKMDESSTNEINERTDLPNHLRKPK
ncbi:uncharacterized protein LOC128924138 [Zeugodacus cucurbitae]|uniref:uncharacterized protein LOC128924138 n=1 Tax=Zeugodacus cucurbitae TaxID=28588 RepID=UPI0023D953DC|nr:uncharacterized protein LOC128924138 [Zeugodacus cucurbitae]XP_054091969.1 uncharacterized protein LOC128924138 [Zeugodacus cucurbitae]